MQPETLLFLPLTDLNLPFLGDAYEHDDCHCLEKWQTCKHRNVVRIPCKTER